VQVSPAWAQRLNSEFMKAGVRGISLMFASGDSGAAGGEGSGGCGGASKQGERPASSCLPAPVLLTQRSLTLSFFSLAQVFKPQWPGVSPWVTAVGGTESAVEGKEHAWTGSSGGFSNYFEQPEYQREAVQSYLKAGIAIPKTFPKLGQYNQTGRAFPDISAQASGFVVVSSGLPTPGVAGTSCASPTAAGIIVRTEPAAGGLHCAVTVPAVHPVLILCNCITSGDGE